MNLASCLNRSYRIIVVNNFFKEKSLIKNHQLWIPFAFQLFQTAISKYGNLNFTFTTNLHFFMPSTYDFSLFKK